MKNNPEIKLLVCSICGHVLAEEPNINEVRYAVRKETPVICNKCVKLLNQTADDMENFYCDIYDRRNEALFEHALYRYNIQLSETDYFKGIKVYGIEKFLFNQAMQLFNKNTDFSQEISKCIATYIELINKNGVDVDFCDGAIRKLMLSAHKLSENGGKLKLVVIKQKIAQAFEHLLTTVLINKRKYKKCVIFENIIRDNNSFYIV